MPSMMEAVLSLARLLNMPLSSALAGILNHATFTFQFVTMLSAGSDRTYNFLSQGKKTKQPKLGSP